MTRANYRGILETMQARVDLSSSDRAALNSALADIARLERLEKLHDEHLATLETAKAAHDKYFAAFRDA